MSTSGKCVSVVILTFNSENQIEKCLQSVESNTKWVREVVVVDNCSSDSTIKVIKKHQSVRLIRNKKNVGFSKGVNFGVKLSRGEWVLVLNPDTVIEPDSIEKLIKCSTTLNAGIAGGTLLKVDSTKHNSFVRRPSIFTGLFDFTNLRKITPFDWFHNQHYYLNEVYPTKPKEVDAVSGALMLVSKQVFDTVGLFDENFFMYLEDVDFCIRAKQLGLKVIFCPMVKVFHVGGASSRNSDKINYSAWSDSRKYYFTKHFGVIANSIIQPVFALDDLLTDVWRKIKSL